jgi:hypothetical protein
MMIAMQRFEIVIDEDIVRREAERVVSTQFFRDLMKQVATRKKSFSE